MFNPQSRILAGVASFSRILAIAAIAVVSSSPMARSADFTEEGERIFVRSCIASFNNSQFTQEQKEGICQCVLDGFKQDSVTNEDHATFIANAKDPSKWSPSIRRVMSDCAPS
ncbi:MAG: hypothetical protein J7647_06265 [Cyanobacteria bacterium SBLK]|nr:hypothetical protein [Cyanobacteria bacterium SBLK]